MRDGPRPTPHALMELDGPITGIAAADRHLAYKGPEETVHIPNPHWVVGAAR